MPTIHPLQELIDAHDAVVPLLQNIPDDAMDWTLSESEWSLRRVIGHLAHANDFYVMIVEEARRSNFSSVDLNQELQGKQRMQQTDDEIRAATTVAALFESFERAFARLLRVLQTIAEHELDAVFEMTERARTKMTTLRERVFAAAVQHFAEHTPQLTQTLARWQAQQQ